jgi:hypothetical protein
MRLHWHGGWQAFGGCTIVFGGRRALNRVRDVDHNATFIGFESWQVFESQGGFLGTMEGFLGVVVAILLAKETVVRTNMSFFFLPPEVVVLIEALLVGGELLVFPLLAPVASAFVLLVSLSLVPNLAGVGCRELPPIEGTMVFDGVLVEKNVRFGQVVGLVEVHDPAAGGKGRSNGIFASLTRTKGGSFVNLVEQP